MGSYQKSSMCQDTKALNALHSEPILFSQGSWEASVTLILVDVHFEKSLTPNNRQSDQQKLKRQIYLHGSMFCKPGGGQPRTCWEPCEVIREVFSLFLFSPPWCTVFILTFTMSGLWGRLLSLQALCPDSRGTRREKAKGEVHSSPGCSFRITFHWLDSVISTSSSWPVSDGRVEMKNFI